MTGCFAWLCLPLVDLTSVGLAAPSVGSEHQSLSLVPWDDQSPALLFRGSFMPNFLGFCPKQLQNLPHFLRGKLAKSFVLSVLLSFLTRPLTPWFFFSSCMKYPSHFLIFLLLGHSTKAWSFLCSQLLTHTLISMEQDLNSVKLMCSWELLSKAVEIKNKMVGETGVQSRGWQATAPYLECQWVKINDGVSFATL